MTNKMAPLDMNNDEAFLNLLSSQRQLLNQLNMENAMKREQQANAFHHMPPPNKTGSILGGAAGMDPLSLMNRPIIERRGSMDYLLATRRASMGMGGDPYSPFGNFNMFSEYEETNTKPAASWENTSGASKAMMKRRRSSLGLLSSVAFDDQQLPSRRFSLLSNFSKTNDIDQDKLLPGDDLLFGFEQYGEAPVKKKAKRTASSVSTANSKAMKMQIESFSCAMEKSVKSQQDIHDWDKKMGLKRSHSKTMRMSMRSRKKLRNLMKKELNAILHAR